MSRFALAVAFMLVIIASSITLGVNAAAHETRMVGPYQFVVGWLYEPAFQGQPNAATIRVTDPRVSPAKPVVGLEKTVTIQVFSGGLTTPFTGSVRSVFGQPGLYALDVFPTTSGGYKYKVAGKVESLDMNETFESGPSTFGDIVAVTSLQYPEQVPSGTDLTRRLNDLQATADQTRLVAIVAVVLGLAALGLGFIRRRA
jgi:hypothetical protein